jgi:hypothetical protein
MSDYKALQERFWCGFLAHIESRDAELRQLYTGKNPHNNEINTPLVKPGVKLKLFLNSQHTEAYGPPSYAAQIYIDDGNADINKAIFHALHADRAAIETEVGAALEWLRLDSDRASRIVYRHDWDGDLYDEARWPEMHANLLDMARKMVAAFRDRLKAIEVKV